MELEQQLLAILLQISTQNPRNDDDDGDDDAAAAQNMLTSNSTYEDVSV